MRDVEFVELESDEQVGLVGCGAVEQVSMKMDMGWTGLSLAACC
jgi:hypothetical protein